MARYVDGGDDQFLTGWWLEPARIPNAAIRLVMASTMAKMPEYGPKYAALALHTDFWKLLASLSAWTERAAVLRACGAPVFKGRWYAVP